MVRLKSPGIRSRPYILASAVKGSKAMVEFVFNHGFFSETRDEEKTQQEALCAMLAVLDNEDTALLKLFINIDMLVTDVFF